jgi:hypothetical protein
MNVLGAYDQLGQGDSDFDVLGTRIAKPVRIRTMRFAEPPSFVGAAMHANTKITRRIVKCIK